MTSALPEARYLRHNPSEDTADLLLSEQRDAIRSLESLLRDSHAPTLTVPSLWVSHLLRAAKQGGASRAVPYGVEQAAALVEMSPSRLKRLAGRNLAPGAYREPGPKGRWLFPIESLQRLLENRRRGLHRGEHS